MQTRRIYHQGIAINAHRRQGPGDTLVCIHGLTDNASSFGRVVQSLGTSYDIVTYDLRAHGDSEVGQFAAINSMPSHAGDLAAIIEHYDLAAVTLVGHSLGAEISLEFAVTHPDLVRALVLVDPPWRPEWTGEPDSQRRNAFDSWCNWLTELKALSLTSAIALGREQTPHWDELDVLAWAQAKLDCQMIALESVLAHRQPWQTKVSQLACPTLLVTGEVNRGAIVNYAMAMEAKKLSTYVEVATIEGAGHAVHRDRFAAFVAVLRQFLRR